MVKFSEEILTSWTKPPSDTEEAQLANSERMVKEAISSDEVLKKLNTTTFGQGSYANDTNVKANSDIDINVRLSDTIFIQLPPDKKQEDYGYSDSTYTFQDYKKAVFNALVNKFGKSDVEWKDKCLTVKGNSYRTVTDVVPTFKFKRHDSATSMVEGTRFISDSGKTITNFPLQHIENGKRKNANTGKGFKRLTRIHKRLRYKMIDDKINVSDNITSFLLECLMWNLPSHIYNNNKTWTEILKQSIIYLYEQTKEESTCKEWGEVSELLYLFVGRKWTVKDVNDYLVQTWNYLEF
jgi:hypothetical protein